MPRTSETRDFQIQGLEIRAKDGEAGQSKTMVGHAAVFNVLSEDLGGFREKIAPGAFRESLRTDTVLAVVNHDLGMLLGKNTAGTLSLKEDSRGLAMEIDLPDTTVARDLITSVERGDMSGASFQFRTREDNWEQMDDGTVVRTLIDVQLIDVSPVARPAYPQADVALRSLEAWQGEQSEALEHQRQSKLRTLSARQRQAAADL